MDGAAIPKSAEPDGAALEREVRVLRAAVDSMVQQVVSIEFAAGILHETNNALHSLSASLNAILGILENQKKSRAATAVQEQVLKDMRHLRESVRTMRAALRMGKQEIVVVNPVDLLQRATHTISQSLRDHRIDIAAHKKPTSLRKEVPSLLCDDHLMHAAIVNLLLNAVDALKATTNRARVIQVDCRPSEAGGLEIEVGDNGVGIAPEHLPRIFDVRFTTKPTGNGLGLTFVRSVVEKMGGVTEITSQWGFGTRAMIKVPRDLTVKDT